MTRRRSKDSRASEAGPDISTPESRVLAAAALARPKLDREGYRRAWARRVDPLRLWRSRRAS